MSIRVLGIDPAFTGIVGVAEYDSDPGDGRASVVLSSFHLSYSWGATIVRMHGLITEFIEKARAGCAEKIVVAYEGTAGWSSPSVSSQKLGRLQGVMDHAAAAYGIDAISVNQMSLTAEFQLPKLKKVRKGASLELVPALLGVEPKMDHEADAALVMEFARRLVLGELVRSKVTLAQAEPDPLLGGGQVFPKKRRRKKVAAT